MQGHAFCVPFFFGDLTIMATRNPRKIEPADSLDDLDSVHEWAIVENDGVSTKWRNPTTGEEVLLPPGMKPTPRMLAIAKMNGHDFGGNDDNVPPADDEFIEYEQTPVDRLLESLRSNDTGGRSEVKIYRVKEGAKDAYCGMFTTEDFEAENLELIRRHYGPGKYRIRIYATNPQTGKFAVRLNDTFEIEESRIQNAQAMPQNNDVLRRLDEMARMQNPATNPSFQTPAQQMKDMLQMMLLMKQVMGGDAQPKSQIGEIVAAIRELRDVSGELSGGGGDSKPDMMTMASQVIGMVANQQQQQPQPQQPPSIPYLQNPVEFPRVDVPPSPVPQFEQQPQNQFDQPNNDPDSMHKFLLRTMLGAVIKRAEQNAPVEPIAADLYTKLPDEGLSMIESELWFEMLSEFHPGVSVHQEWFSRLRQSILIEIAKDEEQE